MRHHLTHIRYVLWPSLFMRGAPLVVSACVVHSWKKCVTIMASQSHQLSACVMYICIAFIHVHTTDTQPPHYTLHTHVCNCQPWNSQWQCPRRRISRSINAPAAQWSFSSSAFNRETGNTWRGTVPSLFGTKISEAVCRTTLALLNFQ